MASSLAVPRLSSSMGQRKPPNLPVIEHPMSRLGNREDLSVQGSGRIDLRRERTFAHGQVTGSASFKGRGDRPMAPPNSARKSAPDRILQWPPEHVLGPNSKQRSLKRSETSLSFSSQKPVEEVYERIRDRLTTGFHGLKHLFKANDPAGKGNVSREALLRILYSLVGYISQDQYSKFLREYGLDNKDHVSFDEFASCFRDNETVQKEWLSPAQRMEVEDASKKKSPEETLKHREMMVYDPYISAPYADKIFKEKVTTVEEARKLFPAACFERDGMIVPPQLREAYAQLGIYLRDRDFNTLWTRYDKEGLGGIRTHLFFKRVGVEGRPMTYTPRSRNTVNLKQRPKSEKAPVSMAIPVVNGMNLSDLMAQETTVTEGKKNGKEETTQKSAVQNGDVAVKDESDLKLQQIRMKKKVPPKLENIIDCLHYKFEESYNAMMAAFELFDYMGDSYIARVDFRRVLQEFGFNISPTNLDNFLSRTTEGILMKCGRDEVLKFPTSIIVRQPDLLRERSNAGQNRSQTGPSFDKTSSDVLYRILSYVVLRNLEGNGVRSIRGQLNYKEFLQKFQSKSENSLTNKVMTTQSHPFQSDLSWPMPQGALTAEELEAKIVDLLHGDFIKLITYFKSCDKYNLGVITQQEFRSAVDKRLGYPMSEKQWEQLKTDVGTDKDGLIPYAKFLQLFDVAPGSWNRKEEGGLQVYQIVPSEVPLPTPVERLKEKAKMYMQPKEMEKPKDESQKTVAEIHKQLEDLFKEKFHTFDKHFREMDRKSVGRMSKWQFGALLKLCGLVLSPHDLERIWATLNIGNDGMYSFSSLIRTFYKSQPLDDSEPKPVQSPEKKEEPTVKGYIQHATETAKYAPANQAVQQEKTELATPPGSSWSNKSSRMKDLLIKAKSQVISNWESLKAVFKFLDKNGAATITMDDMMKIMRSMKFPMSDEEVRELCQRFDLHRNGRFHYLEFMKCYSQRPANNNGVSKHKNLVYSKYSHKLEQKLMAEHKNLRRAFRKLDTQRRGYLGVGDFKKALTSCGIQVTNEDFYHLLCEFDHEMRGRISYNNFLSTFIDLY